MILRKLIILILGLWILTIPIQADELKLEASVDQAQVEVGDYVTLTVTMQASGGAPAPELSLPDGFEVSGRSQSTSTVVNIMNGRAITTLSTTFVYTLRARREGTFVIGPARVVYEGKTYASSKIRVDVVKNSGRRRTRPAPGAGRSYNRQDLQALEEDLFVTATADKQRVYVGEQVTIFYKLYTRRALQSLSYGQLPAYTGFWAETLFDAQRADFSRENYDGREFDAMRLKTMALFPTASGKQGLEQLEVVCQVQDRSRQRGLFDIDDLWNMGSFGQAKQVRVRSEDLEIDVSPLPRGAPAEFNGAVGQFRISVEATPGVVTAGDPVAVKVTVSGTGNLNAVGEPGRPTGDGFKFYDPKSTVDIHKISGQIGGQKTFEYVAIPNEAGTRRIGPFVLVYFDPKEARYFTVQSQAVVLRVRPGRQNTQLAPVLSRREIEVLGEDIRYLKPDLNYLEAQDRPLSRRGWFWMFQLVPALGFLGAFVYKRHRNRLVDDVAYARRRRAGSEASRRLTQAKALLKDADSVAFHAEIHQALAQFLADRLNLPVAGMTSAFAAQMLVEKEIPEKAVAQVKAIFQRCDFARFAPTQVTEQERQKLYKATESLIQMLGDRI